MSDCADCGDELDLRTADAFGVLHFRCPGCGAGGFDTGDRRGGPAFRPYGRQVVETRLRA